MSLRRHGRLRPNAHGTYYVATWGNDAWVGTKDRPWATVKHAADVMVAGDTTYVRHGTYNEPNTITLDADGTEARPITVKAYPGETPVLTLGGWQGVLITGNWVVWDGISVTGSGGGPGIAVTHASNCRLLNFRQTNALQVGIQVYGNVAGPTDNNLIRNVESDNNANEGIYIKCFADTDDTVDGNRVEHCWAHDNGYEGFQVTSDSAVVWPTNTVVQDCICEDNGTVGDTSGAHISYSTTFQRNIVRRNGGPYGGVFVGKTGCVVRNNLIYENLGDETGPGSAAVGIILYDAVSCQAIIENNTIYDNNGVAGSHGILFENAAAGTIIRGNSVSLEDDQCADNGGSAPNLVDENLFFGFTSTPGTNRINADPQYADPANGNFHLTLDSPGIDIATASVSVVDQVLRTRGIPDAGALEVEIWETSFATMDGLTNLLGTMAVSGGYAQGSALRGYDYAWLVQQLGSETHVNAFALCADGSMVAGTRPNGQIYRSTDNGASWSFVQRLGGEKRIFALAQCADGSMVAGTYPNGLIYRSTDNGASWSFVQRLGSEGYVLALAQCADGSMVAGMSLTGQVYRSTDNGASWSLVQQLGSEGYVHAFAPCADGSMIAGTARHGQIYRSTDNGASWSLVQRLGSETYVFALAQCADGSMVAGTYPTGQIYRSTDNGASWSFVQRLSSESGVFALAQCADGSMIAGTVWHDFIYRSTDNGASWSFVQRLGSETELEALAQCADGSMIAGTGGHGQVYHLGMAIAYHEFAASATIDWGVVMPAAGTTPRLLPFRISDAINLWQVRILPNTTPDCYLIERNAGVETVRASADVDWSVGATDEVRVVARGTTITVYHRMSGAGSWTEACSYGSATFNQTATRHGVAAYDTGANVFSYLRMVAR